MFLYTKFILIEDDSFFGHNNPVEVYGANLRIDQKGILIFVFSRILFVSE